MHAFASDVELKHYMYTCIILYFVEHMFKMGNDHIKDSSNSFDKHYDTAIISLKSKKKKNTLHSEWSCVNVD